MMATPKIDVKPTAAAMLKFVSVRNRAQIPPSDSSTHVDKHDHGVEERMEGQIQQHEDQSQRQRDDEHQPPFAFFHLLEFAAPFGAITERNQVLLTCALRIADRAGQVAVANAELDGHQARALFAGDRRSAVADELALGIRAARRDRCLAA